MIRAGAARIGGRFALCMDDPALVAELKALGATTIYRQSGDDPLHNPLPVSNRSADIRAAARAFTDERGRKGADYVHLTNELASTPKLHEFTRWCLERCAEVGWKGVAYNYATHTPRQQYVDALDNLRYAVTTGQAVGVHLYPDVYHDATVAEFLDIRRAVGGTWIATEFNYTRSYSDPHRGWRNVPMETLRAWGFTTIEAFRRAFIRQWAGWLAANSIGACWFCFDPWDQPTVEKAKAEGYGYWDLSDVIDELAATNRLYPYREASVNDSYPPGTNPAEKAIAHKSGLNLRDAPNGGRIAGMPYGERVTVYGAPVVGAGLYRWQRVKRAGGLANEVRTGWAANRVDGVDSFVDADAVPAFRLVRPAGCALVVTSGFGVPRDYDGDGVFDDRHEGLDLAPKNAGCLPAVLAGADGVVVEVRTTGDYGKRVVIEHALADGDVFRTWYCHLSQMAVAPGQRVSAGQVIGVMGTTGNSTGVHLHLNVQWIGHGLAGYVVDDVVDPAPYLSS